MNKILTKALVAGALLGAATLATADVYHFSAINPNQNNISLAEAVGQQLTVNVTDGGSGSVLFTFTNPVGISSSITNVYFSDPAPEIFSSYAITAQTAGVDFSLDAPNPANFPEGGPSFVEVASADAAAEGTNEIANGVNAVGESLTFTAILNQGNTFASLIEAINLGGFQIALQTRDNPRGGNPSTDRWLNQTPVNAVPLPAAAWLFASGLGFFGVARRRIQK